MKKILFITTLLLFALSAISLASPATDYSKGKVALDISLHPSADITESRPIFSLHPNGKNGNLDIGATIGLGGKFAFQYKNINIKTKDYSLGGPFLYKEELSAKEYNILYKIDKNFSAFAGITNAKYDLTFVNFNETLSGKGITGFQVGVIGTAEIGKNLNAYGVFGAGDKITSYEFGIGYELDKNTEFNLFYKDTKYKELELGNLSFFKIDYTVKGLGYGVTLKF